MTGRARTDGSLREVVSWGRGSRGRLALAALLGTGAAGAAVALTAAAAWLIASAALQPPILTLMVAIVSVRAFGIARGVLRYAERLVGHDAAFRILAELRVRTVRRIERLAPMGVADLRSGDLLARFVGDVDLLADVWLRLLLPLVVAVLVGGGAVVLLGLLLPVAALATAIALAVTLAVAPWLARTWSARAQGAVVDLRGQVGAATAALVTAAPELAVYGRGTVALAEVAALDARLVAAERRVAHASGAAAALTTLAAGTAVAVAAWAGVRAVGAGDLEGVLLAVVVLTPLALAEVMAGLAPASALAPTLRSAAGRVQEVLDRPDPVIDPEGPVAAVPNGRLGLVAQDLTVRWAPDAPPVLHGADLRVEPGEQVAIVGTSGSGKSTTAAALTRLVPAEGALALVDDLGLRIAYDDLTGDDVRAVVGLVEQDAYLFDSTIEQNLLLARPEADSATLLEALERVQLGAWIAGLPEGLQTFVGEHGARVSGGQRRRLAVARVLLADHRIVVLDEPAEHVDRETGDALMRDLIEALQGRTLILITHRPEHAALMERVVTLREGRFVETVPTA